MTQHTFSLIDGKPRGYGGNQHPDDLLLLLDRAKAKNLALHLLQRLDDPEPIRLVLFGTITVASKPLTPDACDRPSVSPNQAKLEQVKKIAKDWIDGWANKKEKHRLCEFVLSLPSDSE